MGGPGATGSAGDGCGGGGDRRAGDPYVVGLGGTTRPGSTGQQALRYCLERIEKGGARTTLLGAADLDLPMYAPDRPRRDARARLVVEAARGADALVVATPGYHGGISGLVKNALDYLEDLRDADPPYLDGRAVGCIVTSGGRQSGTTTLIALRSVVHALRGWPTPLGVVVDTSVPAFDRSDTPLAPATRTQLDTMSDQVAQAARIHAAVRRGLR